MVKVIFIKVVIDGKASCKDAQWNNFKNDKRFDLLNARKIMIYLGNFFSFFTLFDSIFNDILVTITNESFFAYVNKNYKNLTRFTAFKVDI